ncbi:hypothetical protein AGMMS50284_4710 [Clostridia bacterium]|nr:hypothetical protein AGMMS50284_4710 [Clostridia bacterium]
MNKDYGVKEHSTGASSGLTQKDKKPYTKNKKSGAAEKNYLKSKKIKPTNSSVQQKQNNNNKTSNNETKKTPVTSPVAGLPNARAIKNTVSSFAQAATQKNNDTGTAAIEVTKETGTAFYRSSQAFANNSSRFTKKGKSRYFTGAGAATKNSSKQSKSRRKFVNSTGKPFKHGLSASTRVISTGKELAVRVLNNGDDVGTKALVKSTDYLLTTAKGGKAIYTTSKYTAKMTASGVKKTIKGSKSAARATKKAATTTVRVAQKAAETAAKTAARVIQFIASNPMLALILLCVLLIILIIFFMFFMISAVPAGGANFGGTAKDEISVNQYNDVYNYITQKEAEKNLDMMLLRNSWTGYKTYRYSYKQQLPNDTYNAVSEFPYVNPDEILAFLSVKYEKYQLDRVKPEIDSLINALYSFDYRIREETETSEETLVDSDGNSSTITTTTISEHIIFTVTVLDCGKYLLDNNMIDTDKKTSYTTYSSFGSTNLTTLRSIYGETNWTKYIYCPYGYYLDESVDGDTTTWAVTWSNELILSKHHSDTSATFADISRLYAPLSGELLVSGDRFSIVNTKAGEKITVIGAFTIYGTTGTTVKAGALIAHNNSVLVRFIYEKDGNVINPYFSMQKESHVY